ncbi:hypothetical protein JT358_08650 [Micrococcales bacterium 31B]|nr:hypothetical protein [Micrococcales bacterium 31B]
MALLRRRAGFARGYDRFMMMRKNFALLGLAATLALGITACSAAQDAATSATDSAKAAASSAAASATDSAKDAASSAVASATDSAKDAASAALDEQLANVKSAVAGLSTEQISAEAQKLAASVPELANLTSDQLTQLGAQACAAKQSNVDTVGSITTAVQEITGQEVSADQAKQVSDDLISKFCQ